MPGVYVKGQVKGKVGILPKECFPPAKENPHNPNGRVKQSFPPPGADTLELLIFNKTTNTLSLSSTYLMMSNLPYQWERKSISEAH